MSSGRVIAFLVLWTVHWFISSCWATELDGRIDVLARQNGTLVKTHSGTFHLVSDGQLLSMNCKVLFVNGGASESFTAYFNKNDVYCGYGLPVGMTNIDGIAYPLLPRAYVYSMSDALPVERVAVGFFEAHLLYFALCGINDFSVVTNVYKYAGIYNGLGILYQDTFLEINTSKGYITEVRQYHQPYETVGGQRVRFGDAYKNGLLVSRFDAAANSEFTFNTYYSEAVPKDRNDVSVFESVRFFVTNRSENISAGQKEIPFPFLARNALVQDIRAARLGKSINYIYTGEWANATNVTSVLENSLLQR